MDNRNYAASATAQTISRAQAIGSRMDQLTERLTLLADTLGSSADRLSGHEKLDASGKAGNAPEPVPNGLLDAFEMKLATIDYWLGFAESSARRISGVL